MKEIILFTLILLIMPCAVFSQEAESSSPVNVFLDTDGIDGNFVKEEFPQVNYVRTVEASNVHIIGTRQSTGSGRQYQFYFIGYGEFAGKADTLSYYSSAYSTELEIKDGYTRTIKTGLLRYLALADMYLDFEIKNTAAQRGGSVVEEDPWNSWVFESRVNGSYSGEASRKNSSFESELNITKVTPEWRYEFRFDYESDKRTFEHEDFFSENTTIEGGLRYWVVKSLGPHAGVGVIGSVQNNSVDNYDFNNVTNLAVEYNFFPYDMSARRQLYAAYFVGVDYRNYTDSTIYNVIKETIPIERVELGYSQKEQWGNVYATVSFQHFFRDFSQNNLSVSGGVDVRIWKGLSWNCGIQYSFINDGVNISKKEVNPEDILLGIRRLSTSSSYRIHTGISFTFGSMYNNVVNTRLKHGGMGGGYGY